jgi:kynurenine formamidase
MTEYRVRFDFEVGFSNGGGLQGQDFRLDIDGESIDDVQLAAAIVRDLQLLMVSGVRILNKRVIAEPHKRAKAHGTAATTEGLRRIDLSHVIEHGMVTFKGLPGPIICDYLSREASRANYDEGTEFQIGRIDLVANTGTYIDMPFHRFAEGHDLAGLALERVADLPGLVVRVEGARDPAIDRAAFLPFDVRGKAVLVHTGWDRHWRTPAYFDGHPFLTEAAACHLRDAGATLVGIDSHNIDDTRTRRRPVHTVLLGAGIPIVEHLTGLSALPVDGFRFSAVPPKIVGMGTFPVRAHACVGGHTR